MEQEEESEAAIQFFTEDLDFSWTPQPGLDNWIKSSLEIEGKMLGFINVILCSDTYLHDMNVRYLNHDTLTDVITFPYKREPVEGDIFISWHRVQDNAQLFGISAQQELYRVIIHGVLHLCGYEDKTPAAKSRMTRLENKYLGLITSTP